MIGTSLNLVGALSGGVKSMMTGMGPSAISRQNSSQSLSPQTQKHIKTLSTTLEKFRLQTPDSHLGLVLAVSDSLVSPVTNTELEFNWIRVENSFDESSCLVPLLTPGLSANSAWYPPCADDIGNIIRIRCTDTFNYGVMREFDSDIIQPDQLLVDKVEEAVEKDRITAKVIISSIPKNLMDDKLLCELNEFEVAGSIEIGSKGILICEKGIDYGGLRYLPSNSIEVRCCQPCSFILRVPIPDDQSNSILTWAGKEEGSLFHMLQDYVSSKKTPSSPSSVHHQVRCVDLLISCRDRLIRDSLVLSIRAMAAFVIPEDDASDSIIQRRLDCLPWKKVDQKSAESISNHPSNLEFDSQSLLIQLQESLERERMLNEELELRHLSFKEIDNHSDECDGDGMGSLADISTLTEASPQNPNKLQRTSRRRDESGNTSCSDNTLDLEGDERVSHFLSGEVEIVNSLADEIENWKEKCAELQLQLSQIKSTNIVLQNEVKKYRNLSEASASGEVCQVESPHSDELLSRIRQHLSETNLMFQSSFDNSKENTATHDAESELSGTDSSEHSITPSETPHVNVETFNNLKKLFELLTSDLDRFVDQNTNLHLSMEELRSHSESVTTEKQQLEKLNLELRDNSERREIEVQAMMRRRNDELQSEHQKNISEMATRWTAQQNDYEIRLSNFQKLVDSYQANEVKNTENMTSLQTSLGRLTEEYNEYKKQSIQSMDQMEEYNHSVLEELNHLKEKYSAIEQRNHDLQNEILTVSDSKQTLMKQMNASDTLKKQMNQMKSQINTLNHELQGVNQLNTEKSNEYERLNSQYVKVCTELEHLKKMNEKSVEHLNEIRQRNTELELNLQSIEGNKNGLIKENNRLRNTINQLSVDKEKLNELEPLYNQQLSVLANIHSKTSELETILTRTVQSKHHSTLSLITYELNYGQLQRRYQRMRDELNGLGLSFEDTREKKRLLEEQLNDRELKIKLLKQDLNISKQAEPFVIKKLNYMLAKIHGEKNHFENKAKSLSKDLQKRLLEGTPLQRELGRVTARLEELENERNAYRDAMVLACDVYATKDENGSWFLY